MISYQQFHRAPHRVFLFVLLGWALFADPKWGKISCIKLNMRLNQTRSARCLSTGRVHAAVAATAWVIGKENIDS